MSENRPVPRPRRARPAPDEGVDPIVPTLAAVPPERGATATRVDRSAAEEQTYELPADVPRRRRGTPMVQVNVRLPAEIATLLDDVTASTGALKAEVIESAIRHAYGQRLG